MLPCHLKTKTLKSSDYQIVYSSRIPMKSARITKQVRTPISLIARSDGWHAKWA